MKYFPYIVILVLLCVILFGRNKEIKTTTKEIHTIDTVYSHKIDTFFCEKPIEKEKRIVDTFFVFIEGNKIELPKEQKHYHKDSVYDAWVSGFKPSLDSIKTYNKTTNKTITHEITKFVSDKKTNFYIEGGLESLQGNIIPKVGVSIQTKKNFSYGANIGLYKNSLTYEFKVGFKINK